MNIYDQIKIAEQEIEKEARENIAYKANQTLQGLDEECTKLYELPVMKRPRYFAETEGENLIDMLLKAEYKKGEAIKAAENFCLRHPFIKEEKQAVLDFAAALARLWNCAVMALDDDDIELDLDKGEIIPKRSRILQQTR